MKKFCLILLFPAFVQAQKITPEKLQTVSEKYAVQSFKEFYDLLSLPNDAHFPEDIEKNVQWCEKAFAARGFTTLRLKTQTVPLLLAERKVKYATKTVLIYLQIDGQPVDASAWHQESPWKPTLKQKDEQGKWNAIPYEKLYEGYNREWRIFARATSDAKGPAVAFLASLDALKELKTEPNFNMKVIMDFEEELGSPHLPQAVKDYKKELTADMLIIF